MFSRWSKPTSRVASTQAPIMGGPTFALRYRLQRLLWSICWTLLAAWTPPQFQPWRRLLLVLFGAKIHPTAIVRGSVRIWWPANLKMGAHASMGPRVICYNVAEINLENHAIVSQGAHLCTGTHDVDDRNFPLKIKPIHIRQHAWVAAEAFVGPGVTVGHGAVLGARGVAFRDLSAWTIYAGNPSRAVRSRRIHRDEASPADQPPVDAGKASS